MAEPILGEVVGQPVLNLIGLLLRRGRIEQLPRVAAEFRRLDNARQGITHATATSAAPLEPGRGPRRSPRGSNSSPAAASSSTSRSIPACSAASSSGSATA